MRCSETSPVVIALAAILTVALATPCARPSVWAEQATRGSEQPPSRSEQPRGGASDRDTAAGDERGGDQQSLLSEESLARFHELLRTKPLHGPAFASLVKHYAEQDKLDDLVGEYEEKARELPEDQAFRIVLARLYLRVGRAAQAAAIVEQLGELDASLRQEESKLLVFKSEVFQRTERMDEAIAMLERAFDGARAVAERLKLSEALADLFLRANQPQRAANALTRQVAEFPDNYFHRKRIADALSQRNLNEPAAAQYRELLELVGNETDKRCEVLRQLGGVLERLNRRSDAIEIYKEAINLLRGGHWLQRELHDRVVTLYRASGRLDNLIEYCREQIARAPEATAMRSLLADVLAAAGNLDEARKTLHDAVRLFPRDQSLSARRIEFLERIKDADGIADEYERIIAQYPDDIELYVAYGQFLASHERIDAARNQWKHVLDQQLTDATLASRLGTLFEQYELTDDAADCYERAIALAPNRPEGYTALARLWFSRGDRDKATQTMGRLREANPDDASTHAELAQTMIALGLLDDAAQSLRRAAELAPDQVRYQLALADLLVQLGRVEESFQVRRGAIDRISNPQQQAQAIDVLVSMHGSAGQLDQLKQQESRRLSESARSPVSLLLLARAADFERDLAAARQHLLSLLAVQPAHEEGRRQLAQLLEASGDVDSAVAEYGRLIELHPSRARYYYQAIADVKLRYSDRAGAIETFEQMVRAAPDNATVLQSVAEQLVRLDELDRAIDHYEQSLRIQTVRYAVRLDYAKALQKAGRLEESLVEFKKAALQRDDRDTAVEALGRLHEVAEELGELEHLLAELEAHVFENPQETVVVRALAELLVREYEYSRATKLLDLVLNHYPRDVDLRLVRAELLRRLTRFDDALEEYRRVLRFPQIDQDFVLGEMGKAYFEAGRVEEARQTWRRINGKLYAGTLLRNNGLLSDAIAVLQDGIRLKPDDFALHRNLVRAMELAGKPDEALQAARRLLDLEPDNLSNVKELAEAYLKRGDRAAAADVAARLFSAGVTEKQPTGGVSHGYGGMPMWAYSAASVWGYGGRGPTRNSLERAVEFFQEAGLVAELEDVLTQQLAAQPDNAVMRFIAVRLFSQEFNKPEIALKLLRELETARFPLEYQGWLGQTSQRDHFRVQQYQLIGSKPALRDARLVVLGEPPIEKLARDELIELAIIRHSLGNNEQATQLLNRAVAADPHDLVALSILVDVLTRAERLVEAEPHTVRLINLLRDQTEQMEAQVVERVRRDFVRQLPLQYQLRLTDELLRDIARKSTAGQNFISELTGFVQTMGYYRARLTLATICAKTNRMAEARSIWNEMAPSNAADAEGWTMLAAVAQLHDQQDLAYKYYEKALGAAKLLAADPLLNHIFGGGMSSMWFGWGNDEAIDTTFNKIVEAFAGQDKLIELYDFLRETDQGVRARRVAEQYKLYDHLKQIYRERVRLARDTFQKGRGDALGRSIPYFMQVCKLAELYDHTADWPEAQSIYEQYLADFPDELGMITTLGEVAEAHGDLSEALKWEHRTVEAKERLSRRARDWALREIYMPPAPPEILAGFQESRWEWQQRWRKYGAWWGSGSGSDELEVWPSWMRIVALFLSMENSIGAADAMQRALATAGADRPSVAQNILALIKERQLTAQMLPVLRAMAVHLPTDQAVQLAFGESLEASDKQDLAAEVYQRMLRRGVSDVSTLTQVRQRLTQLAPEGGRDLGLSLAAIESEVAADPDNANNLLRLARVYYYSLNIDQALETLLKVDRIAPHLEGVHDLFIEIYTIRGDSDKLLDALRTKAKRVADDNARNQIERRIVDELLTLGKVNEALEEAKKLANPRDPSSFQQVAALLQYFGRYDEAVHQYEQAARSGQRASGQTSLPIVQALALKGDNTAAADRMLQAIDEQARQASQYGGMYGSWAAMFDSAQNNFTQFTPLFVIYPELEQEVRQRLEGRHGKDPKDPAASRLLTQFYRSTGREDLAEKLLDQLAAGGASDRELVNSLIDRAVERGEYDKAIELAEAQLAQQAKPQLPPGIPPQFADMMNFMSERNLTLCKLGDIYWKLGNKEKAFESYRKIIDEKLDQSKVAYATICLMRGRTAEARDLVDQALTAQAVKSPSLLQFRALVAAVDNEPEKAFDLLAQSIETGGGPSNPFFGGYDESEQMLGTLAAFARQTGLVDRFVEFMKRRIGKQRNKWENYLVLAHTLRDAGRVTEALEALSQAEKLKTLERQAVQQRIEWLEETGARDELIPLLEKLIDLSEKKVQRSPSLLGGLLGGPSHSDEELDTAPLRERLGDLLWECDERERAIAVWSSRLDMTQAETHLALGSRYEQREAYDLAEQSYRKALELDPTDPFAHRAMAKLASNRRDFDAALRHLHELYVNQSQPSSRATNYQYQYQYRRQSAAEPDLVALALTIAREPAVQDRLRASRADEDSECRLMLAALTGDWAAAESELDARAHAAPYDTLVWRLFAKVKERRGQWTQAVTGWERVLNLKQTTIPQRREHLKVLLAGKQIKDAAAGVRQAGAAAPPAAASTGGTHASMIQTMYGGWHHGWDDPLDTEALRLAAINLRLNQFDKAERLYLRGKAHLRVDRLTELAQLMLRRGATDRSLELSKIAAVMSNDVSQVAQYARQLAQRGSGEKAKQLLVRAYGLSRQSDDMDRWSMISMMSGMRGMVDQEQFEDYRSDAFLSALYEMLLEQGTYEQDLAAWTAKLEAGPGDMRLGKLIFGLQARHGDWTAARETLRDIRNARPDAAGLTSRLFDVNVELGDWDAALEIVQEVQKQISQPAPQWVFREAFVYLMKADKERALATLAPILDAPVTTGSDVQPTQLYTFLLATRDHGRLIQYLEKRLQSGSLDESGKLLLCNLYLAENCWSHATQLALDEFWNQGSIDAESAWSRVLNHAVHAAMAQNAGVKPDGKRSEDRAIFTLITDGPQAGKEAFRRLVVEQPNNLNARRGLVLAADLDNDLKLALETNQELLDWLSPRRLEVWRPATTRPLQQAVAAFVRTLESSGGDSMSALGMSASFLQMSDSLVQTLAQALQSPDGSEEALPITYTALWDSHQRVQQDLLLRAGDLHQFVKVARAQENRSDGSSTSRYAYARMTRNMRYLTGRMFSRRMRDSSAFEYSAGDWKESVGDAYRRHGLFSELARHLEERGPHLEPNDWLVLSEVCAAMGRHADATKWREQWVEHRIAELLVAEDHETDSAWSWQRMYGRGTSPNAELLQNMLQVRLVDSPDRMRHGNSGRFHGPPDTLWELALADPKTKDRLLDLERELTPHSSNAAPLEELISYFDAAAEPQKVIELIEHTVEGDLLESRHLGSYLKACYRAKDFARVEKLLADAEQRHATLKNTVLLERLMLLRHQGRDPEAEQLELQLASQCHIEPVNPWQPDVQATDWTADQSYETYRMRRADWFSDAEGSMLPDITWEESLATIPSLAAALGVPTVSQEREHKLTLGSIRSAYMRHGLLAHALRMVDQELQELPDGTAAAVRLRLIERKADLLYRVGEKQKAREALEEVESFLIAETQKDPAKAAGFERLARLYASPAFGPDYEKAHQAHEHAARQGRAPDRQSLEGAFYLFELGRYDDAWRKYEGALARGELIPHADPAVLYRAGFAAHHAGQSAVGQTLLRQALWHDPFHKMAERAKELSGD